MKVNTIKETVERILRTEYIAEDGTVFYDAEECREYERSALFVVSNRLKRLARKKISQYDLNSAYCEDDELEIFDVQTKEDLENLCRYLYLKASKNGASDNDIKCCLSDPNRLNYTFEGVTFGHEVMVFWNYEGTWFWFYKDGSLNGYFEWMKESYNRLVTPEESEEV